MLTEGPIAKRMFFFTLPILAGNVLQSLSGSINAMWIGRMLGETALTASSNANVVLFFLISVMFGFGMATTVFIGQALGRKDLGHAKRVIGTSASFFAAVSLAVAGLGALLTDDILGLLRTPPDARPLAVAYLRIVFAAMPLIYSTTFVMMSLRGAGDAKTPFIFLVLSIVMDAALNPLLITRYGIAGSAMATFISTGVSFFALLVYLYRTRHFLRLERGEFGYLIINRFILKALVAKGVPMGLQMIVISGGLAAMMGLVNHFGSQTAAAYGATFQLWNYIQMPALAVSQAVTAMAAQNVGARRWDRVTGIARAGLLFNFLLTGSLVLVAYAFGASVLQIFLRNPAATSMAVHINALGVWSFVFLGVSMVLSGLMRSTGTVVPPLLILVFALWGVRFPFAWLMQGPLGADAIWWSFPVGAVVSALLSLVYYRLGSWRMIESTTERAMPAYGPRAGFSA